MSDMTDKIRIKQLEEKDDYRLWRIRISAACDSKGIEEVLEVEKNPHTDAAKQTKFVVDQKKASNVIVAALSDKALRVVRSSIGKPFEMLRKLDERYDSKSAAARISKMTELITMRYDSINKNMGTHIDQMAAVLEQLEGMNTAIPQELSIALLIASIQAEELHALTAAVKTLNDDSTTWEKVTARLLEEHQSLKGKLKQQERATPSQKHCELCRKRGHAIDMCWLNPKNPNNRLDTGDIPKQGVYDGGKGSKGRAEKASRVAGTMEKPKKKRAAVAKAILSRPSRKELMMLDSGTTTHMTNDVDALDSKHACDVPISLGDDSEITATQRGTTTVNWKSQDGETEVLYTPSEENIADSLTKTLVGASFAKHRERLHVIPASPRGGVLE